MMSHNIKSERNVRPKSQKLVPVGFWLILAALCAPSQCMAREGAKDLYYRQIEDSKSVSNIGFTYSIELERKGKTAKVDNRHLFKSGDEIRFHVRPNIDGYMYILLSSGSAGGQALLFPAPGSPEKNTVKRGQDYVFPEFGNLAFDNKPGMETLKIVLSKSPLGKDAATRERGIMIMPKSHSSPQTKVLLDFAEQSSEPTFSDKHPATFVNEPAVTVVSQDTKKPLAAILQLRHGVDEPVTAAATTKTQIAGSQKPPKVASSTTSSSQRDTQNLNSVVKPLAEKASQIVQDKWALVVGISKFSDPRLTLMYPKKDATDFADFLVKECNFAPDHIKLLTDGEATRERILTELGTTWLPANAKENDLVLLYIASHGTSQDQDVARKNFLVAYDTRPENPFATGIEINDLARTIKRRIAAKRIVVMLDTCHSGAAEPGAKGFGTPVRPFDFQELVQGTGQMVVASAAANQKAHDSMRYTNGIFTKHLMDGLRKHERFSEAFQYTRSKVQSEAMEDFHNHQTPVLKSGEWKGEDLKISLPPLKPREANADN